MNRKVFEEIMDTVIAAEVESYEFYRDVAGKVADEKTCLVDYYKISETVQIPTLSTGMSPTEAIALAMKKEEAAMNAYSCPADVADDPGKKHVFAELQNGRSPLG